MPESRELDQVLSEFMRGSTIRICDHTFLPHLISSNSIVVDLGAFDGDFAHAMIDRFQCRVFSAEPVRELFERIRPHPLHRVFPVAVGGKNETIEMNVYGSRCASVFGSTAPDEKFITQSSEMVTLSEFCRRAAVDRIDLLKLDIEGAEIELFENSSDQDLLSATQITVEFHDFIYPEQRPAVKRIIERMGDIGFWVVRFSLDNTNVLFLNRHCGIGALEVAYLRSVVRYGNGIGRRLRRIAS
jgi:FkbM family methyltransferase